LGAVALSQALQDVVDVVDAIGHGHRIPRRRCKHTGAGTLKPMHFKRRRHADVFVFSCCTQRVGF
jgi:hypothetical protein